MAKSWKKGGCHCGAVQWEAETEDCVDVDECNCSICLMVGYLHIIVPQSRFKLLSGEDKLSEYTFNTGVAKHKFCNVCGVKSFYIPRSNPDGVSLNLRCMNTDQFQTIDIRPFDGQHWEANDGVLAHLSKADD